MIRLGDRMLHEIVDVAILRRTVYGRRVAGARTDADVAREGDRGAPRGGDRGAPRGGDRGGARGGGGPQGKPKFGGRRDKHGKKATAAASGRGTKKGASGKKGKKGKKGKR
jgi:hypothetical protein